MKIIHILKQKIEKHETTGFIKFGDGEFFCMANTYPGGHNVDRDNFTESKGKRLIEAFNHLVVDCSTTLFIGKWHDDIWDWRQFLNDKGHPIQWADYHTLLLDGVEMDEKIQLYSTIKASPLLKIYVGNPSIHRVQSLLNINYFVAVSYQNWFDHEYDRVLASVIGYIDQNNNNSPVMVMVSAGMAAKILLSDILLKFPNTIVLDFGSAFDLICAGRPSRTWEPPRGYLLSLLSPLIDNESGWT